jgi:hypothetical protein
MIIKTKRGYWIQDEIDHNSQYRQMIDPPPNKKSLVRMTL